MKLYHSKYPTKLPGIEKVCSQCFNWRLQQVRLEKGSGGGGRGEKETSKLIDENTGRSETLMSTNDTNIQ